MTTGDEIHFKILMKEKDCIYIKSHVRGSVYITSLSVKEHSVTLKGIIHFFLVGGINIKKDQMVTLWLEAPKLVWTLFRLYLIISEGMPQIFKLGHF